MTFNQLICLQFTNPSLFAAERREEGPSVGAMAVRIDALKEWVGMFFHCRVVGWGLAACCCLLFIRLDICEAVARPIPSECHNWQESCPFTAFDGSDA